MLHNWIQHLKNSRQASRGLGKAAPKLIEAFQSFGAAQNSNGALDAKTRELIALAVAVTTRCDSCMAAHAKAAVAAGVTEAELADALGTAMSLNAGAAYAYSVRAFEAFEQWRDDASSTSSGS